MFYKTLFAPHSASDELGNIEPVIQAAQDLDCHLNIVVLGELTPLTMVGDGFVVEDYWQKNYTDAVKRGEIRADEIRALTDTAGISATIISECLDRGQIDPVVRHYAMTADATIMLNLDIFKNDLLPHIFSSALMNTSRPLIMLGTSGTLKGVRRAVIAWDLKPQSADALRESIPFIQQAEDVTLLSVNIASSVTNASPGDEMALYLARHGIKVTVENCSEKEKSVGEVIAAYADTVDADLIVMGAYSHSRFRDWLIGSTTRDILSLTGRTLLMCH